jgi:hypothetical protein
MTTKKKTKKPPKSDWRIYRWKLPNGDVARGFCKTTEDPWEYWEVARTISMEHRATIHGATEKQAREVMEVLLV